MDTFRSNAIIKLRYNKAKLWSIKLHSKRTGRINLCLQVIYHISNGAILWKPDANNLGERMSSEDTIQNALGNTRYGPGSKTNLILCRMVECNFQGFQELQFWKWNIQHFIIQDVRCLYQTDDALVGSSIDFVTQKPCSN